MLQKDRNQTATNAVPALRVHQLHKSYGYSRALRGAAFELRRGERLALLGPNGAGKTTLIRCIMGRARPDQGTIELFGRLLPARGGRNEIGLTPQEIALYPDLSARENLELFARFHGLVGARRREQVDWALAWTGLEDRAGKLVRRFSGGMKRRLNLACGVLHQPSVILLDEPTVGVDPQSRARIFEMLEELRATGASIVLTTHQLDEAEHHCDRIVIIDHGTVIAEGSLDDLVRRTLGDGRQISATVAPPAKTSVGGMMLDPETGILRTEVFDIGRDLPRLLEQLRQAGHEVVDLDIRRSNLQAVFLRLTGRELRE